MPVGSGSIKRASKKAAELEEKKVVETPVEGVAATVEVVAAPAPAKKPRRKPAAKKAEEPVKSEKTAKAEEPAPAEPAPVPEEGVRNMLTGELIANQAEQLGKNERVEVLQDMPVFLL